MQHHRSISNNGGVTNCSGVTTTSTLLTSTTTTAVATATTALKGMDGIAIIRQYVDKMVQLKHSYHRGSSSSVTNNNTTKTSTKMKILLLDAITTQIMSAVTTQTEILQQQIYYVTTLEKRIQEKTSSILAATNHNNNTTSHDSNAATKNSHLTAICFVRPTLTNVELLCQELQQPPHYAEYYIYFTGTVPTTNGNATSALPKGLGSTSTKHNNNNHNYLRKIAEADVYEKVQQIYEYYADFVPANRDLWTIQCRNSIPMTISAGTSFAPQHHIQYERHLSSVSHMILALQQYPTLIRYAKYSPCANEMAHDLSDIIQQENDTTDRFHFRNHSRTQSFPQQSAIQQQSSPSISNSHNSTTGGGLVILIVDRRDDPVTPLLSQWTYQAMVHELLGLNNHRVLLKSAPDIPKELEEVVLSIQDDAFYEQHQFSNFGVLGEAIQQLLREYQQQTAHHTSTLRLKTPNDTSSNSNSNNNENLATVADMQQFMEKYPELRTKSHVVSKHVAIMSELARLVQLCSLMDVSQFEQALACQDDHSTHWRELLDKLSSPTIKIPDKLRLSLLYALRYETSANLHMLQQMMSKGGVPQGMIAYVATLLRYAGYQQRTPNRLYADSHNLVSRMTKNIVGAVAGVDNVYAQHVPLIIEIVQQLLRGKLSSKDYPAVVASPSTSAPYASGNTTSSSSPSRTNSTSPQHTRNGNNSNNINIESIIPDDVLIFMVGGVTYEEGLKIAELNKSLSNNNSSTSNRQQQQRIRIVLAGSTIHNSTSFLEELRTTM
jgi:vacuolar protein sorting-associated protein 45